MRFSAVFDPIVMPIRIVQSEARMREDKALPEQDSSLGPLEVPEDLDQRVRQMGEWQLEDW